jgi:hypothetical protein
MARVRLEPFGTGQIFPHEQTHSRAKEDRLKLTKACRANLSQIFGIYPDPQSAIQRQLEDAISDPTPLVATDHLGVVHKMWQVTDEPAIARAVALMADRPVFVADGHHRYETACNYRDLIASQRSVDPQDPVNFVLMMCIGMDDPGLVVLPTHRLFRGVAPMDSHELRRRLGPAVETIDTLQSPRAAASMWEQIEASGDQACIGLYTAQDDTWSLVQITEHGRAQMQQAAPDKSADWQHLGVAILHELIIKTLLKLTNLPSPSYVHSIPEVITALATGDAAGRDATGQTGTGERFQLAALVQPASVQDIRTVSSHGERMPAKSTYFYPKLLCGLVFNSLE